MLNQYIIGFQDQPTV